MNSTASVMLSHRHDRCTEAASRSFRPCPIRTKPTRTPTVVMDAWLNRRTMRAITTQAIPATRRAHHPGAGSIAGSRTSWDPSAALIDAHPNGCRQSPAGGDAPALVGPDHGEPARVAVRSSPRPIAPPRLFDRIRTEKGDTAMATFTVWKFDSAGGADEALATLERLQKEEL